MEGESKNIFARLGQMDMTKGNLFLKLILFSLPLALASMMQLLYTTVDLISVRFGDGVDSAAAISANGALINLIVVFFNNIALGSNVALASAKGAKDQKKGQKILHTSLIFASFAGVFVAIVGFFVAPMLLEAMHTEAHLITKAGDYLRLYFIGVPFLMIYNYSAQLCRAQGDSRSPFLILAAAGLINVGFDCMFVFLFHMGVKGVALATVISQAFSAIVGVLTFRYKKQSFVRLRQEDMRIDGEALKEILRIGIPAGLQGFFFSLPNVFIQSKLYSIDPGNVDLENGAIASSNIENYMFVLIDSVGMATMSFVAQNYGAKNGKNIKKVFIFGQIWSFIYYLVTFAVAMLLGKYLLRLFVESDAAISSGLERLTLMASTYALNGVMNGSAGTLRGYKYSTFPMINTLVNCTLFRIIYLYTLFEYVPFFHTLTWLYALFPITWGLAAVANVIAIIITMPRVIKKLEAGKLAELEAEAA